MRGTTFSTLLAGTLVASLLGCGGSQSQNAAVPVTAPAAHQRTVSPSHVRVPHDLYVLSQSNSVVYMLRNKTYQDLGVITNGINGASDVFVDKQGNLYVANSSSANVAEYPPGATSPSVYYSAGMKAPSAVTVDAHGNVFEGDNNGTTNEYFQGYNVLAASCQVGGPGYTIVGIAVDSGGDVFVNVYSPYYSNEIVEYFGGLGSCYRGGLTAVYQNVGHIALDAANNLLVPVGGAVQVLDPPYTSVSSTIGSGFSDAVDVKLNKANTEAFVTDAANHTVTVVSYPGGSNITVLGKSNGLINPYAAVDGPDAVY